MQMKVLSFGSPQVIMRGLSATTELWNSGLWCRLNAIQTVFINQWDIVPRLTSCRKWVYEVLQSEDVMKKKSGPFTVKYIDGRNLTKGTLEKVWKKLEHFRHVGILVFLGTAKSTLDLQYDERRYAAKVMRLYDENSANKAFEFLSETPEPSGLFVVEHHSQYPAVTKALLQQQQAGSQRAVQRLARGNDGAAAAPPPTTIAVDSASVAP